MENTTDASRLLSYMPLVQNYNRRLSELGGWWQKITLIGKINSHNITESLFDDMEGTRAKFQELQSKLIANLIHENLSKNRRKSPPVPRW